MVMEGSSCGKMKKKSRKNRARDEGDDRISSLPDELIHEILFRIPIHDAVRTCILSKRWTRLWCSLPHLNFDFSDHPRRRENESANRFGVFVEKFLSRRNHSTKISTISIFPSRYDYRDESLPEVIPNALKYAISHNVQEIIISCRLLPYEFSLSRFNSASLKILKLFGDRRGEVCERSSWGFPALTSLCFTNCKISLSPMYWSLPALKTLVLIDVEFHEDDENLRFQGFDHLENLTLEGCTIPLKTAKECTINIPNLKNLIISIPLVYYKPMNCKFVVSAPNLSFLEYRGSSPLFMLTEDGFPRLEKVDFDIILSDYKWVFYNEEMKNVTLERLLGMFQETGGAKFLTLSLTTIEVLSRVRDLIEFQTSPFGNVKCLTLLDNWQYEREDPTKFLNDILTYLLNSSPGAKIYIQLKGKKTPVREYNPEMHMLCWSGSRYFVVAKEDHSSDNEHTLTCSSDAEDTSSSSSDDGTSSRCSDDQDTSFDNLNRVPDEVN